MKKPLHSHKMALKIAKGKNSGPHTSGPHTGGSHTSGPYTGESHPGGCNSRVAVVLVRGFAKIPFFIEETFNQLHLHRKNVCVIINDTPAVHGVLLKIKDYITWGEISEKTVSQLVTKRGVLKSAHLSDRKQKYSYRVFEHQGKKYLPYFRLNPPLRGFGRKGIKVAFAAGGALGYRGEKINDLIERML